MFSLLKLELKKFNFNLKFLITLICNIVILGIVSLIFFNEKDSFNANFESLYILIQITLSLISMTFMIFASTLISSMITSEYRDKTITLLFTYPISRRKLLSSKLLLIFLFTFLSMIFSAIFVFGMFYAIVHITNSISFTITADMIFKVLFTSLIVLLKNSIIALIPVYFGIKTKCTAVTIISGFLIACFLHSSFNGFNLSNIFAIPMSFILLSIFIIYIVLLNVYNTDVN